MAESTITRADSEVSAITFFEDRAEVVRVVRCKVPAGRSRVHAHGITLLVDDRSLVCKASGVEVVYSRVRRTVEDVAAASAAEVTALEEEVALARERLGRAERAQANAHVEGARVAAMLGLWVGSVAAVPSRAGEAAKELERAYAALDAEHTQLLDAYAAQRTQKHEARDELARVEVRLEQARQRTPRYSAFAEVEIVAPDEREVAIEVTYRTPCALWRPEHLARLTRNADGTAGEITITSYATVWQATGETWKDVRCRFSTARPARSASAPHLREDVLVSRKKSDMERRQVVVEARDQAIDVAGAARGTRDVDEMPGVDDGGEAQWLDGRSPATIASDGHPVRVEIGARVVSCKVERVCFPELGSATHLRANGTLPGPGPLLAGPVTVGRETEIVGKAKTELVGAGEPFELGFGVDDGLRVRRKVTEKRKTTAISGTQHVEREVTLYVSNLSSSAKGLSVVERVPVSEVEDVEITLERTKDMRFDARDGFATFDVSIAPHATREIVLAYKIEAKSNVVLPPS
ncbi:MAG: DUF4139 domain-containing protein [Labilithrix sp.]|nr:DUF4139 domain-containing protein [Labilithrix sp.]MCW5815600.1 DUF4139 domain-containing protein [Labilithrix sp.]